MDLARQIPNALSDSALQISRAATGALAFALAVFGAAGAARAQLPDLVPEVSDVHVEWDADVDAGDVAESCASATTGLDLVRLSLTTLNAGQGVETLGDPMCPVCATHPDEVCGNPDFICSPAGGHDHPHYQDFLRYEIVDPNGVISAVGGKRSFCLAETMCPAGVTGHHTCLDQGLDPGCWDVYPYWLGCQYVDVTGVPDGSYSLRVTVDPLGRIPESDEDNNVISTPIVLQREPLSDESLEGGSLVLKPGDALHVSARAPARLDLADSHGDPTHTGATLYVFDTGSAENIGFGLPASGWKRLGPAHKPRAFRYRGDGSDDDPCKSVLVTRGGVRASCKLNGSHTVFKLPAQGDLLVQLRLGIEDRRVCVTFGGKTVRNDAAMVKRRGAELASCDPGS
ncbi:MAG: lysyl oxidase family protein [Myxococcota bacterium]